VSPTEVAIAELWQSSLRVGGIGAIGAMDNFFDSGGDSLRAMQLANRMRNRFGVDIAVRDVFQRPTLRDLAAHVDVLANSYEYGEV